MYFIFNLFKSNTFSRFFCSWVYLTAELLLCDILPYDHIPKLQKRMGINLFVRRKECNTILDKIRTEGILSIIHLENDYIFTAYHLCFNTQLYGEIPVLLHTRNKKPSSLKSCHRCIDICVH